MLKTDVVPGRRHIHLHFTWQAWYLVTSTVVLRGRHGTDASDATGLALVARRVLKTDAVAAAAVCVAGVALGDI